MQLLERPSLSLLKDRPPFQISCELREKRFSKFVSCTLRAKKTGLEYSKETGSLESVGKNGSEQDHAGFLTYNGLKVKVHDEKGNVVSCSKEGIRKKYFRFKSEADLHSFQREISQWPEVFRRFQDYYKLGEKIGEGHTCRVYLCQSKLTGEVCAIKLSSKGNQDSHRELHNELRMLRYLKSGHPSLPELRDYFYDAHGNMAIVLEYLNTRLGDYLGRENLAPEETVKDIMFSILHCVKFLHEKGLAHRDLKVENLMFVPSKGLEHEVIKVEEVRRRRRLSGFRTKSFRKRVDVQSYKDSKKVPLLKIIDYGFAKMDGGPAQHWEASTPCGTTRYMAPEMVKGTALSQSSYSQSVDTWSLGCILYFMFYGKLPFSKLQVKEGRVEDLSLGRSNGEGVPREISAMGIDLLTKLLNPRQEERIRANEAIHHPWFDDCLAKEKAIPMKVQNDLLAKPSPISVLSEKIDDVKYKERQLHIMNKHACL